MLVQNSKGFDQNFKSLSQNPIGFSQNHISFGQISKAFGQNLKDLSQILKGFGQNQGLVKIERFWSKYQKCWLKSKVLIKISKI